MMLSPRKCWNLLGVMAIVIALAGCVSEPKKEEKKEPQKVVTKMTPVPKGSSYAWSGFPQPAPTPQDARILVEKIVPKRVDPTGTFNFQIIVTNNADYKIDKVLIKEAPAAGFKFIKSMPNPNSKDKAIVWDLGAMLPGQKRVINITGSPTKTGTIRYSGETDLQFAVPKFTNTVQVIRPDLVFSLTAPDIAIIGEKIPVKLKLRNIGQAPVFGTRLVHHLPKGLLTFEGKSKVEMDIGDFKPNQEKDYDLVLKGDAVGLYSTTFTAVAQEGIVAKADMKTKVTKPELEIVAFKAPKKRFVGKLTPYDITVKNKGDAIAKNMTVKMAMPESTSLASANENGQQKGNFIVWKVAELHPGASKRFAAKLVMKQIMTARAVATAEAYAADKVEAVAVTDVAGLAALLCELVDINDPVPLGEEEIYELKAINQGSLDATKIRVTCALEDSMEFVKSSGATKSALKGNKVVFEPLPALSPQAVATWRIRVKAKKAGDVRFTVKVESDQLTRPVELTEPTHFYE